MNEHLTRREFVQRTGALAAPLLVPAAVLGRGGRTPPSERIRLGIIGCGGMGRANLANCARHGDVVVTAACDVWKERRDAVVAQHADARPYDDFRELLQSPDVDAVIVATPPHWHTLHAIAACEAGKDLYLQKPMTLYPDESLAVRNAVRRHGRVCQVGTQIHAGANFRRVVEYLRSGKLGHVGVVRTFNVMNQGPAGIGRTPATAPPSGLDWERWVGPAPMRPYDELIVRDAYHNCSFMDFSGGWTPGMAPHILDLPYWAFELDFPTVASCSGGRYVVRDAGDAPDTQEVHWQHGDRTVTWSMSLASSFAFDFGRGSLARRLGTYFHGVNGTLFADYDRFEVVPEGDRLTDPSPPPESLPPSPGHEREWLDCIRSRQQPSCAPDYHAKIDVAVGLANLSYRLGRSVRFDPKTERVVGDDEAAAMARPVYREGWRFPAEYCAPSGG